MIAGASREEGKKTSRSVQSVYQHLNDITSPIMASLTRRKKKKVLPFFLDFFFFFFLTSGKEVSFAADTLSMKNSTSFRMWFKMSCGKEQTHGTNHLADCGSFLKHCRVCVSMFSLR